MAVKHSLGWIGMGRMGYPMAERLLKAGHSVAIWNRTRAKAEPLAKKGGRIVDYPNLDGYLRDLYQHPGIAQTVNFEHIKRHYYITHADINPTRIVPIGPALKLGQPHGRETM